ncbi:hypothetical protein GCM10011391_10860 [Pullulanibacillus camelliae]|uniref:Uncharacterized protein n=1 Tax=Pullulanibacillus camelliae TaxID=1707096 RepID=A0A8J2VNI6_9BACL|nr:hypothetical protein [Pullulanibacillus camelliae]GGE33981.1 hypothetical protein GCM10011391_10860 [Pullulanibacillus camelliae]
MKRMLRKFVAVCGLLLLLGLFGGVSYHSHDKLAGDGLFPKGNVQEQMIAGDGLFPTAILSDAQQ